MRRWPLKGMRWRWDLVREDSWQSIDEEGFRNYGRFLFTRHKEEKSRDVSKREQNAEANEESETDQFRSIQKIVLVFSASQRDLFSWKPLLILWIMKGLMTTRLITLQRLLITPEAKTQILKTELVRSRLNFIWLFLFQLLVWLLASDVSTVEAKPWRPTLLGVVCAIFVGNGGSFLRTTTQTIWMRSIATTTTMDASQVCAFDFRHFGSHPSLGHTRSSHHQFFSRIRRVQANDAIDQCDAKNRWGMGKGGYWYYIGMWMSSQNWLLTSWSCCQMKSQGPGKSCSKVT